MKKAIKNYLAKLHDNKEKGFSLVELIIVMAIMAILVGVVASQVIPYMEKSRQAKDQQQLSSVCTDLVSSIAQTSADNGEVSGFSEKELSELEANLAQNFAETRGKSSIADAYDAVKAKFKSKAATDASKGNKKIFVKDEQNNSLIYDPSYAWIIPAGANSKPAYIAIEGATLTKEVENDDWSRDIQVYKKVGVGVMLTNDICVYRNTALTADLSKAHG